MALTLALMLHHVHLVKKTMKDETHFETLKAMIQSMQNP